MRKALIFVGLNNELVGINCERFFIYFESIKYYKRIDTDIFCVDYFNEVKNISKNYSDFFIFCNSDNFEDEMIFEDCFIDRIISINLRDGPSDLGILLQKKFLPYIKCFWHFYGNFQLDKKRNNSKINQEIIDKESSGIGLFWQYLKEKTKNIIKIKDRENDIFFSGRLFYGENNKGRYNAVKYLKERKDIKKIINIFIDEHEKKYNVYDKIKEEFGEFINGWIEHKKFLEILSKSKFSLSLFGHWHTYRFMESSSVGSIPICENIDVLDYPGIKSGFSYIDIDEYWNDLDSFFDYLLDPNNEEMFEEIQNNALSSYYDFYYVNNNNVLPVKGFFEFLNRLTRKVPELKSFLKNKYIFEIEQNKNRN